MEWVGRRRVKKNSRTLSDHSGSFHWLNHEIHSLTGTKWGGGGGHILYYFVIFDDCANRPGGGTFQLRSIGALAANIYRQVLHSIFLSNKK